MLANETQAARIFAAFGGARPLCRALRAAYPDEKFDVSAIYRWNLPKSTGGTGGIVPTKRIPQVKRAARIEGIVIPDSAWCP